MDPREWPVPHAPVVTGGGVCRCGAAEIASTHAVDASQALTDDEIRQLFAALDAGDTVVVETLLDAAESAVSRHHGNAARLRRYWVHGPGAVKIMWGADGAFARCVTEITKYMPEEKAKGYCNLRYHEATGRWPGQVHHSSSHARRHGATSSASGAAVTEAATKIEYADPGYQKDKVQRYPLDTDTHVRSAWAYINQKDNAAQYSAGDLKKVRVRIIAAMKRIGVDVSATEAMINGKWSYQDVIGFIRDALRKRDRAKANGRSYAFMSISDATDSDVVYADDFDCDDLWVCSYSIDSAGTVTLGEPSRVVRTYAPAPAAMPPDDDAGDDATGMTVDSAEEAARIHGRLLEAKGDDGAGGRIFRTQIISYGESKNGRRYPESVMRTAVPLYEGARVFDHHRSAAELQTSTIRGLVGHIRNVEATTSGLEGDLHLLPSATHAAEVIDASLAAQESGLPVLAGISHDVQGSFRPVTVGGQRKQEATVITGVNSVDLVAVPAAGGRAVRMIAGGDEDADTPDIQVSIGGNTAIDVLADRIAEAVAGKQPPWLAKKGAADDEAAPDDEGPADQSEDAADGESETDEQAGEEPAATTKKPQKKKSTESEIDVPAKEAVLAALKDLTPAELAGIGLAKAGATSTTGATESGGSPTPERTVEAESVSKGSFIGGLMIENMVRRAGFGDATVARVRTALPDRITESTVEDYIAGIKDALAMAETDNPVRPVAATSVLRESAEKKIAGLDAFFRGDFREGYHSFRQAWMDISGYRPQAWDEDVNRLILRESAGTAYDSGMRSTESLTAGSWDQILGDSITRRMVAEYARPGLDSWRKVVSSIVPLVDYRTQRRTRFGGYGTLPTVSEGQPYNPLTSPSDEEVTYAPAKRGGTEDITLEMIANDDVGAISRIPRKLGVAAAWTLYRFVWEFFAANPTIYDSVALFHSSHSNTGSSALSQSTLSSARIAMRQQAAYGDSTDVLSIIPRTLIVPSNLEEIALQLTTSHVAVPSTPAGPSDTPNIHQGLDYLVVDYWTDTNNWFVACDPAMCPTIEIGFLNGKEDPELFTQNDPTNGSVFNADVLTYKIRHVYGGAVEEYRGLYGAIV